MGTQDAAEHTGEAGTLEVRDPGSLHNRLDLPRGDPRVCFASHEFIHWVLVILLQNSESQVSEGPASLSTERCPCLGQALSSRGRVAAETTVGDTWGPATCEGRGESLG